MLMKLVRFIVSLVSIPLCVAVTVSFYNNLIAIKSISESGLIFILGALSYSILHLLLFKLDFLYVLGHELTHAAAAVFSGNRVMGINVLRKEGSVKTSSSNFFVTLAPYLIPGYTVFIAFLYFLLSFFIDVARYSEVLIFLTGFTLMFHLAYTAGSIKEKQSDLIKAGYLFSISFIYIINLTVVFFIINLLFKEASFFDFLAVSYEKSKDFYYSFWRQLFL